MMDEWQSVYFDDGMVNKANERMPKRLKDDVISSIHHMHDLCEDCEVVQLFACFFFCYFLIKVL